MAAQENTPSEVLELSYPELDVLVSEGIETPKLLAQETDGDDLDVIGFTIFDGTVVFNQGDLSGRQRTVAGMLAVGLGYEDMSSALGVSVNTLSKHGGRAYERIFSDQSVVFRPSQYGLVRALLARRRGGPLAVGTRVRQSPLGALDPRIKNMLDKTTYGETFKQIGAPLLLGQPAVSTAFARAAEAVGVYSIPLLANAVTLEQL